ncbi:transcriptional regulator, DeoR family [Coriobacterium glomerans PW2]|uniref:Lactose phosphotransferase system repressor n=1 Tax=Coriobacterium glomerans (strain ATCC 49209 / DSM 20642 / JCM 10262 / PW2) TaxID=700015 RepID=F2NBE8_CORGP|nr:DeoR/GlpR family DNA-binding transcription regulator [Coriobacterium glomerans]AEB06684.1 transcriptional regulator, DeoR family [Coriobacterium glomerans PW2]
MLKEERQQRILDILNEEQKVIASDLSMRLAVSEDTIRRDLKELDGKGKLKRVHSGALRVGPPVTDFIFRTTVDSEIKHRLALKALPFIKEGSVIIIDGGTTNLALVQALPLDFSATVITNSPPLAIELASRPHMTVINLGGCFYKNSMINVGVETYKSLQVIRADLYVMGIYNINTEVGTSVPTAQEADIKREMTRVSTEVLGMVTTDKFGTVSSAIVGPVEDLNYLISDAVSQSVHKDYAKKNLLLID